MSSFFNVVSQDVARNPVARAVQRAKLESAMRDFQVTLYYLEDGTQQADNLMAAAQVLAVALRIHEARALPLHQANVLRGAMSCIKTASDRGFRWRHADAPAIDAGMARAVAIVREATAILVQEAWKFVAQIKAAAA